MRARLYIDGKDAYTMYGVYVQMSGWNELISMPPLKAVPTNDWQEEDGVEVDLSEPVLDSREVSVRFAVRQAYSRYFALMKMLSDGAYHTFDCVYIGRTFRLRLIGVGSFSTNGDLGEVTLKFADDFPLDGYKYQPPVSTLPSDDRFALDGVPFSDYGVRILKGTLSEITKTADVKTNLYRNIKTQQGAIYDSKTVTYKSKDVRLSCLMTSETVEGLWHNYDALLYDLTRPDERELWVGGLEQDFACYYKSCQVSEFFPDRGKAWLRFTLTLTFTHDFRILDDDTVLATESDIIIFTEDGQFAIEMQPNIYSATTVRLVNNRLTLRLTSGGAMRFND